jgi:hypothetical protein
LSFIQNHMSRGTFLPFFYLDTRITQVINFKVSLCPLPPPGIIFNSRTASFKAYCAIWIKCFNFRHQTSPRVSPRESTQRRKVQLWARNVRFFYLNADLHVTFRDLLHAVKPRHGTDALLPLRRMACWEIFRPTNPTALAGREPANLGTKDQHATSRPPEPLLSSPPPGKEPRYPLNKRLDG